MMGLSKRASQAVVNELALVLGNCSAAHAIGIADRRLKTLAAGSRQLSESELRHIYIATKKTWRTWLLDAIRRAEASDQILGATTDLVNGLNDAEMDATKKPRPLKKSRASRVV